MRHGRKCICNFAYAPTRTDPVFKNERPRAQNLIHKPDVRREEIIFLHRGARVAPIFKGQCHPPQEFVISVLSVAVIGFVNMRRCFFPKPKIIDKTLEFVCCYETEAGFLTTND